MTLSHQVMNSLRVTLQVTETGLSPVCISLLEVSAGVACLWLSFTDCSLQFYPQRSVVNQI